MVHALPTHSPVSDVLEVARPTPPNPDSRRRRRAGAPVCARVRGISTSTGTLHRVSNTRWLNLISDVLRVLTGSKKSRRASTSGRPQRPSSNKNTNRGSYPGDFTGTVNAEYSPSLDGEADPGEVVWTWVPYEDDSTQGKDRPVLVIGRDTSWLLVLMLTSKDHDLDAAQEARWGRYWQDIGTGPWDTRGRPSEVRLDRIIRIDPTSVRREGAIMPKQTFTAVVAGVHKHGH